MVYYYGTKRKKDEALSGKTCPRCGTTMERASNSTSMPGIYKWACPKCGYVMHTDM
jgi:transposase